MITICNILPNSHIKEDMPRQAMEMYLTHQILKDPQRFEFLAADKKNGIKSYKILDNSACELGQGLDFDLVLKAAKIIGADEVVLPDIPRSGFSLSYTLMYLKDLAHDLPYKLAAVVQGETREEVMVCAEQLLELKRINTIMIPKWYCQMDSTNGMGRYALTKSICGRMEMRGIQKEIHWLGLDTGIREVVTPCAKVVRSVDTGYFAAMSTDEWKHLDVCSERPRDLQINLDQMDVNEFRFRQLMQQQRSILKEMEEWDV